MRLPLSTLEVFNAIAHEGSLRTAALALGIKPSTVSHQLKNLEQQLGTALFIRTTRSVNLTQAGRELARRTGPAFDQLGEGLYSARTEGQAARGVLKLAVPEFAYFLLLRDRLASFQKKFPEIEIEMSITDALSDILEDGFHAGFRLGGMVAQDMIAKKLTAPLQAGVFASPGYLELHGVPKAPQDLLAHNCLRYRFQSSGHIAPWRFDGPDGAYPVDVRGTLIANSLPISIELAEQGLGLAFGFQDYCKDAISSGRLVEVLQKHQAQTPGIHIYFPQEYRAMVPLRLFIEHIQAEV